VYQLLNRVNTGKGRRSLVRLNAEVDEERRRSLYHALLDDDLSFAEWLRRQIDSYLAEKEPRGKKKPKERG